MTATSTLHDEASSRANSVSARPVDGLGRIPAGEWDALLAPRNAPLRHDYLIAWENSELPGLRSCPVMAAGTDGIRPIAACPGYFYRLDLIGVRVPAARPLLRKVRRVWPGFMYALAYELGSPTALTNPFLADPALRPRVVPELIRAGLEEAKRCRAQFVFVQNFTSRTGPAAEQLSRLGFAGVPILQSAVVDLGHDSFDDYLGAMRAHYRRRARDVFKRSEHLSVEQLHEFSGLADELARLWRLVYDRASEEKRELLTAEYFRGVSRLKGTSVLLARRPDGSIASFGLLLADHPWLWFLQCGFEAESGRSEGSYLRLLLEVVRAGLEGGYEQVDLGTTTLEPKLEVGAVPVPLFAWIKHRNPLMHRLTRALANGPLAPPAVDPRHVFKESPPTAAELVSRRGLPS